MRIRGGLGTIGLCALLSGCELASLTAHNLSFGIINYAGQQGTHRRDRNTAALAWKEFMTANPRAVGASRDFVQGFEDGFTCYLDVGGTGAPPPVPPSQYWTGH